MQIKLKCPSCGTAVEAENINIDKLVAKCGQCHTVFSFEEKIQAVTRRRPEVLLPPGIEAYSLSSEIDMLLSWRRSSNSFLLFFTIMWNAILSIFVVVAIASGSLSILLFISLHLAIGIGLLYYTIATLFNTTHINVDHYNLLVEHRPIRVPFFPDHDIPVTEVDQIFIDKYVSGKTNGQPVYAFGVNLITKDGKTIKLVRGLKDSQHALYIEQEVEKFLSIPDRPVDEEWKG